MIQITLPMVTIEKVTNGFVVEWRQLVPEVERKGSERTRSVVAIAPDDAELLKLIAQAANDISKLPAH